MSHGYQVVGWNRFKKRYDVAVGALVVAYGAVFIAVNLALFPDATLEIILIRATGTAGFVLLHTILCLGPLARFHPVFLPLLYNRRHLGVMTFFVALAHATLVVGTYHAGASVNPLASIFLTDAGTSVAAFPFQALGFFALAILFLMAATSHDFWLSVLTAPVWKALHMSVYVAYALLVAHVAFGALQSEKHPAFVVATALGFVVVLGLHLAAAWRESPRDRESSASPGPNGGDGFVEVCAVADIPEKRARVVALSGERVAVFLYDGKVSAVSSVCQHQNGPLGEGRILDGCITCPWHGYQYRPDDGTSPAPFTEKVPTFRVRVLEGRVWVHPQPNPPGTRVEPALIA